MYPRDRSCLRVAATAVLLAAAVLASACSPDPVSSSADRGAPTEVPAQAEPAQPTPTPQPEVQPTPTPEGPQPLRVVLIMGETGVMAPIDAPAVAGAIAAIDRLNDNGGILNREIEVTRFDTNSRTSVAERTIRRTLDRGNPDLIITSCDAAFSEPVLERADQAGLVTISPCADDVEYLTGALGSRNFTFGAPGDSQGAVAARDAFGRYGPTAMVLRDVTSPEALQFCDGFERTFREVGGSVTYRDEFNYDTLVPIQDRLKERGRDTDFIVLCSHVPGGLDAAPSVITMIRSLGYMAPLVAGSTLDQPDWFAAVPPLGELTFVSWSSIHGNDPNDDLNDLLRAVNNNEDTPRAGVTTVLGADAIEAWARAVDRVGTADPGAVASAMASYSDEPFWSGEVSFSGGARMDVGRTYRLLQVVEGELSVVGLQGVPD